MARRGITKTRKLIEYVRQYPTASNQEIAEATGFDPHAVASVIARLRTKGNITQTGSGSNRCITVLVDPVEVTEQEETIEFKKEALRTLIDTYFEDFMAVDKYTERLEIGKMICRILDKL